MKTIYVMSALECMDYVKLSPEEPFIIISIRDTENSFNYTFRQSEYCREVLILYFDDIEKPSPGLKLFDREQALKIIAFTKKHEGVEKIVIHCHAGQSRSAAVGSVLSTMYTGSRLETRQRFMPNTHVLSVLAVELKRRRKFNKEVFVKAFRKRRPFWMRDE